MAFYGNGNGLLSNRRGRRISPLSDINIVPLVDVVLVLLIIFMLTAHVMEFGLEVEVPKVRQVKDSAQELPVVTVTRTGQLYLNDQLVNINELAATVGKKFGRNREVYLRADKAAIWDVPVQVMSVLGEAKYKVNVVTQPVDEADRPGRGGSAR
jgi:biopolymer transport protein ExbD